MTEVSAEWVNGEFTVLKMTVPEEGMYRISYSVVNKSSDNSSFILKPLVITTDHGSRAVFAELNLGCFYTLLVKTVLLDSMEAANESVGIGEYMHVMLTDQARSVPLHTLSMYLSFFSVFVCYF